MSSSFGAKTPVTYTLADMAEYQWVIQTQHGFRSGVGKLFRKADRFKSENFYGPALKININIQQFNFISAHVTIGIQCQIWACFAATILSHLGMMGLNYTRNVSLDVFDVVGPSSSTSDSWDGADLFPKNLSKEIFFTHYSETKNIYGL